ncbi:MAG: leucine--tRNA ligase [Patescibacteria group bacterium]|nr:leucine--tRNA ligase [Patescibacteria group bacterium]
MAKAKFNHQKIEKKWQKFWEAEGIFKANEKAREPFYVLDMFAYPSGEGMHVGHPRGYTASDILAKYYMMQGKNVLHPFGWDAFGLPAENYAVKVGVPPAQTTKKNIANFKRQLKSFGMGYDWDREINTSDPNYYKWTQWIFKVLFDNGYAYQKEAYANWCPKCQTVLANEQVVAGQCERCDSAVEQKKMKQWFFKFTAFAQELIDGLAQLDWPESTKEMQKNWIGRSEGAELEFAIDGGRDKIKVFTTRPDTLFGVTYMVLAPEHELVEKIVTSEQKKAVERYVANARKKSALDRTAAKEKTGVFTGAYVVNPANHERVPVWVADYVLADYGFGAVMAVPAHDERDNEFAKKYDLRIVRVIESDEDFYAGYGKLINSSEFDGQESEKVIPAITKKVGGKLTVQYKLHDWLISRQRYWGAPIPIIYVPKGSPSVPRGGKKSVAPTYGGDSFVPVSMDEKDLPVILPNDVDFKPTGESPLASSKKFQDGVEARYGKGARREVDTMDTFVCSSWYFLRYCDPHNTKEFAGKDSLKYWMPVDFYVGGAEHTNGHLLYARFMVKVLHKLGYLDFDEPFLKLRHQGMIQGEDGEKMSKSRGNVVNPDEVVEHYGADTMRMYEMFMGPFAMSMPWSTQGMVGVRRFLDKVWGKVQGADKKQETPHALVAKVTEDMEGQKFNTVVSTMMEFINEAQGTSWVRDFTLLLAPFAPHLAEEIWQNVLGEKASVFEDRWPRFDTKRAQAASVVIAVQEMGKLRGTVEIARDASERDVLAAVEQNDKLTRLVQNSKKHVFVPNKIINFIN